MSGREATKNRISGRFALSVGLTAMPSPPGWVWVRLTDIADLETGHTPSKQVTGYWNGDIPWIGIKDARTHHGKVVFDTFQTITQDGLDNSAARLLPEMTVCLSRTASVGYVVIMGKPMATSQDFVDWICSEMINPRFLMHLFIAEKESLRKFGKGTTHKTIYFPEVKAFHVCVPPRNEQRRIVTKLEALQRRTCRARAALDAIPPLLEKFRQSVLSAAFRGDLTADWRAQNPDAEPASVLLERIREERRRRWEEAELAKMKAKGKVPSDDRWKGRYLAAEPPRARIPNLPRGWQCVTLDQLSWDAGYGTSTRCTEGGAGVPVLRIPNVVKEEIDLSGLKFASSNYDLSTNECLRANDFLIVRTNGSRDLIGRAALVTREFERETSFASYLIRYRLLGDRSLGSWISSIWQSSIVRQEISSLAATSAGQYNISLSKLGQISLPLPPEQEIMEINNKVAKVLRYGIKAEQYCQLLTQDIPRLEQSILSKAFRGELVPQDPNDEPASNLLERLCAAKQDEPIRRGRRRFKSREPEQQAPKAEPPRAEPAQEAAPQPEPPLPDDTDFRDRIHRVLLGRGPLEREAAIREVASALRDDGTVDFQRLRRDGPLFQSLDEALDSALAADLLDEPVPGEVRAVLRDARDYTPDDWRHALLSCLGDEPAEREDAIEAAAIWAAENMGLEFQRLRQDGVIVKGIKSALRAAIRRGEVERLGPSRVRKSRA